MAGVEAFQSLDAKEYFTTMLNLPAMQEWRDAAMKEPYVIS